MPTMYKNNTRDGSKYKHFSPLQLYRKLKDLSTATGYYSYTHRQTAQKLNSFIFSPNDFITH